MEKNLLVIAGPNGSGKSTILNMIRENPNWKNYIYISPDEVVKQEIYSSIEDELTRYRTAMQDCQVARQQVIDLGYSLAFETVFSTKEKMDFLQLAKVAGYEINVVFVSTENPQINLKRVAQRVTDGGHNVPPEKIISRYERSMNYLYPIFETADYLSVYDNSGDKPLPIFYKGHNLCYYLNAGHGHSSSWLSKYFVDKLTDEQRDRYSWNSLSQNETEQFVSGLDGGNWNI